MAEQQDSGACWSGHSAPDHLSAGFGVEGNDASAWIRDFCLFVTSCATCAQCYRGQTEPFSAQRDDETFQSAAETLSPSVKPGQVSGPQDALLLKEHIPPVRGWGLLPTKRQG